MKDFYWDIRPKPEFGTIELRVCDTPLTVDGPPRWRATCRHLPLPARRSEPFEPGEDDYLVYTFNRFQACRFGLDGEIVDPQTKQRGKLRDDILRTLARVDEHAVDLKAQQACLLLREILHDGNDAGALRRLRASGEPLAAVVESAAARWMT